jgi:hypothetical protein
MNEFHSNQDIPSIMPTYFLMRIASILIVLLVSIKAPNNRTWVALVYSFGFTHYLMALIYSKRQFGEFLAQPLALLSLLSISLFGAGLYLFQFPLLVFFAVHHAFNEAYVLKNTIPSDNQTVRAFRASAALLHLFLYFVLLRHTRSIGVVDLSVAYTSFARGDILNARLLWVGLALSYMIFFHYLYQIRSFLNSRSLIENCAFELLGLVAVVASFYVNFKFLQIVFFHFVFWSLFPLPRIFASGSKGLVVYLGVTTLVTGLFLLLSPIGGSAGYSFSSPMFQEQFKIWSYIHITSSFMLSNAHPSWIVGLFRPSLEPRAVAQQA